MIGAIKLKRQSSRFGPHLRCCSAWAQHEVRRWRTIGM